MDRAKLVSIMSELAFSPGQYAIFGGACLAAHGIRSTADLEIFVSPQLYGELSQSGWEERITGSTAVPYLTKVVQGVPVLTFITCGSKHWRPNVQAYLQAPEIIDSMPLSEIYAWKKATARPKDLADLNLIEMHWSMSSSSR